ncbi:MAG TPA: segregation/condensation protein A [Ktedonobacteraceae bacterium]|nr:segregation/condensation protein A [Ktedonobacteraceae bacterium]
MLNQLEQDMREEYPDGATAGQQSNYVVHLPVFEGPLDLLLHLIEKRQMEITTISLLAVTDQYLNYLRQWQQEQIPLANMAAFISIASRLLYIKSQSLLPHTSKEELAGEQESAAALAEELRAHLLEYKLAKEIAGYLRRREEAGLQTYGRSGLLAGIEAQLTWTPPTLIGLEVNMLAQAFQRILELRARDEANSAAFIPLARVRVSERIAEIVDILRARPQLSLSELLENKQSRLLIIVTFLAILELWKREHITVAQNSLFSPITLERGERWDDNAQIDAEEE